jgi:hypothetical protein
VEEYRRDLLQKSPIALEPETKYSAGVKRALMAALSLDDGTRNFEIIFKCRAKAELDLLLDDSTLHINEKWLDFQASHIELSCWLSSLTLVEDVDTDVFSCDHIVANIYDSILTELRKGNTQKDRQSDEKYSHLRLRVSESLRQMPRMIENTQGENAGEIKVSWTVPESNLVVKFHRVDLKCRVTLHRESSCGSKRFDLFGPIGEVCTT